ncbi:acetyl-CoA C-acetyltransferase [Parageobacillus toebii NBRC 107807]|uniref:acetyl-CoA C-acetyltransferase n=1 Tax=Parageobacillus toebii NBRC 107807 TaxID=1223503 RepID=A0A6G9J510_9BACL|nr:MULTISPECIES: acetyl-CoA C-acetyltransferase [Bacillaceae]RDV21220.1 acetyl-CoA C-acetyltransferase [Parageobacillus toebii]MBB3869515.1 acetyl-CoA C-acetyltransferase [Parageobacillus toebii NBRC 107807]PUF86865.1 acetyl-CoA C-acetyltransferase [Geobacillus sp. LYN3]QIQ33793.1 acetyl-CoA C-acetyltransferase [Parageobacillus toebii NBRC 107807]TXK87705.1 acetyl-CoA C-acetyltransferase [Geobacillus sp. AYS3]
MRTDIVLLEGARTAFAKFCGSFRDISATDLGAIAAREAMKKAKIEPEEIHHVVFGNVQQSSRDAHLLARHVGLKAGVPIDVPAVTVNRLCGTGLEAILMAARFILSGEAEVVLAGGTENMSQVPHVIRGMRWGTALGSPTVEDWLWDGLYDTVGGCSMAITAENLAKKYHITREEADRHALRSHQRALAAIERRYFQQEIVPVTIQEKEGEKVIDTDEHPRQTSMEQLGALKPRFIENGVVTAGNASGMNDGAAAVVVASGEYAAKRGLKPLARLVSWGIVGVEPQYMGIGPVPAIRQALEKANLSIDDLDLIEINEAFSAQYLACQKELGFDDEKGNVNGGAVAIGHPLAASGTRITLTLVYELARRGKKYGVSSLCIGGGQGIAAIWERL